MKTKITLHFYAKSTKSNSAGQFPIYVRLTVNGKRLEFSTKKFVEPSKWSSEMTKMKVEMLIKWTIDAMRWTIFPYY